MGCTLREFARIQADYPEARLIVAGFGSGREHLERQGDRASEHLRSEQALSGVGQ